MTTLQLQYRTCGRTNCRCARGEKHGPYIYAYWREQGQLRCSYLGKATQDTVREEEAKKNNISK